MAEPVPAGQVAAYNPKGKLVSIPAEQVDGAAQAGYRILSNEQAQTKLTERREGATGAVKAFGESAASALTLGGSDVAGRYLLGDEWAENRKNREEAFGTASTLGTIAGIAAPALVTGGASAAAEGAAAAGTVARAAETGAAARGLLGLGRTAAKALPSNMALNLGRAAEGAVAKGATALGVTGEGLAGRAALGATKMAASGAVEGAAYGAGQAVSETALAPDGDYSKLAERVIAGAKDGALFGAALGGAVGGVSGLGSKFASKMAESVGDLGQLAEKNAVKAIAADSRAASEAIEAGHGTRLLRDDVIKGGRSLDETLARAKTVGRQAEDTIGNTVSVLDDAGRSVETKALQSELAKDVMKPLAKSNPAAAGLLEKELQAIGGAEAISFQDLHRLTSSLDSSRIWGSAAAPAALKEGVQKAQRILTRNLDDSVSSGLKSLSNDEIHAIGMKRGLATEATPAEAAAHANAFAASMTDGGAARAFAEAQQSARAAKWAESNLLKKSESVDTLDQAAQLTDNIKGAAGFAAGLMSHGLGMGAALGTATSAASTYLRKHGRSIIADLAYRAGQADLKLGAGVKSFMSGTGRRAAVGGAADVDAALSRRGKETRGEAFERTAKAVRNGVGADQMVVHSEAPQTGDAMKAVIQNGMAFLATKLPPGMDSPSPFYKQPPVGAESVATFAKYVKAVKDPLSVLDSLNNGTVSAEELEALEKVYPNLHAQIKEQVTAHVVEHKGTIPESKSIQIGVLFGIPTVPILEPGNYEIVQASYTVTEPSGTKTSVSATGPLAGKIAKSFQTDSERLEGQELGI